ncbi:sugar phosphate isomerase/epimerase [Paenibacillus albidus]|uniref:sugar phosphate isomerase/epimerase family protein n=1 Tax=Paenibacillus albidus TaxID=2041023 RepID=UPI001BE64215|nr:TIM barrel protein [Paenibacillus albidus]MBT2288406.1 sugar phosphate isomerase/epimerase [Paenibacillus albidus]
MKKNKKKILTVIIVCISLVIVLIAGYGIKENVRINKIVKSHKTEQKAEQNDVVKSNDENDSQHITTAVQQIMIGTMSNNYDNALQTLLNIKNAGYESIELNDFMIHKSSILVKLMTKFSGMPIGNAGKLDWPKLIEESGLKVLSIHSNLGSIENDAKAIADEAKNFGTDTVVITGMYRFDYSSLDEVEELAGRLNQAGKALSEEGIRLLYHNHNVELQKVTSEKTAYDIIIEETDPAYVNFEFDSYWMADGGANVPALMEKLGSRMKLWHINDRGYTKSGPYMTPILKENATELGYGNMDLDTLSAIAIKNGVEGVILETHKNWVDNDPIKSLQVSAEYMQEKFGDKETYKK